MNKLFPVIILAGGLATRLRPITNSLPKSLIPIRGRPFIDYQLKYLSEQGITDATICLGYLGEQIEAFVKDGSKWELKVTYSYDGVEPIGTGGAIMKALELVGKNFFILYGDSFLPVNFYEMQKMYSYSSSPAMMAIIKNENQWDKSNVIFKDGKLIKYDKNNPLIEMEFIDYGLTIMDSHTYSKYNLGSDLSSVYSQLSEDGSLAGYEVFQRFYEVGSKNGIKEFEFYLMQRDL